MDQRKSKKIRDIVMLQKTLKKWRKLAIASRSTNTTTATTYVSSTTYSSCSNNDNSTTKSNKVLKKTISSSDIFQDQTGNKNSSSNKSTKFLKKTFSFSDISLAAASTSDSVPKGSLAVCVGKELKRFVIPTEYLSHRAFEILLREAEEEFGFQQEGVLRIPCEVPLFERILEFVEKKEVACLQEQLG